MRPRCLSCAAVTLPDAWLAECALESAPESAASGSACPARPSTVFGSGSSASLSCCDAPEADATGRRIAATTAATRAALPTMPRTLAPEPGRVDPVRSGLRDARDVVAAGDACRP